MAFDFGGAIHIQGISGTKCMSMDCLQTILHCSVSFNVLVIILILIFGDSNSFFWTLGPFPPKFDQLIRFMVDGPRHHITWFHPRQVTLLSERQDALMTGAIDVEGFGQLS